MVKQSRSELTPLYARHLVRLTRPFPNFDFSSVGPLRRGDVRRLQLQPGARVLDAGCGLGGSFPYLVKSVGATGEVVGVEISPEMTINARRRIQKNEWANVKVIEGDARTVELTGMFDGLLMLAAPDVYASPDALANILPHLNENARIVFFGAKTSTTRTGALLNPLVKWALCKLSFPTTPPPDSEPWRLVAEHVRKLELQDRVFGSMFLASGSFTRDPVSSTTVSVK